MGALSRSPAGLEHAHAAAYIDKFWNLVRAVIRSPAPRNASLHNIHPTVYRIYS